MLGGLLGLGGVSGFLGASNRSANLLNISVVVCIMGLLLSFQFIGEVRLRSSVILPQQCSTAALGSMCHGIRAMLSHLVCSILASMGDANGGTCTCCIG